VSELTDLLAAHREDQSLSRFACSCGWTWPGDFRDGYGPWLQHVAGLVEAHYADRLANACHKAWEDGRREGRYQFAYPENNPYRRADG
jgi:hypothetical protein